MTDVASIVIALAVLLLAVGAAAWVSRDAKGRGLR